MPSRTSKKSPLNPFACFGQKRLAFGIQYGLAAVAGRIPGILVLLASCCTPLSLSAQQSASPRSHLPPPPVVNSPPAHDISRPVVPSPPPIDAVIYQNRGQSDNTVRAASAEFRVEARYESTGYPQLLNQELVGPENRGPENRGPENQHSNATPPVGMPAAGVDVPTPMPTGIGTDTGSNDAGPCEWPSQNIPSHEWSPLESADVFSPSDLSRALAETEKYRRHVTSRDEKKERFRSKFLVDAELKERMKRLGGNPRLLADTGPETSGRNNTSTDSLSGVSFPNNETGWQSQVSPGHWGNQQNSCSTCQSNACDCPPATEFAPFPLDPPVYDPRVDPVHQKKSFNEILYYGRKFGYYDLLLWEPRFQRPANITSSSFGPTGVAAVDFETDFSNRLGFGFESKQGPGGELSFTEWEQTASIRQVAIAGSNLSTVLQLEPAASSFTLSTSGANQTLALNASTDLQFFDAMAFKQMKLPISTITGQIGVRYLDLEHELQAVVFDAGGTAIGQLLAASDFRGFGPRLGVSYNRPIGHTRFEMQGSMFGSILAGDRDFQASTTANPNYSSVNNEQFVTASELRLTLVYRYKFSDSSSLRAKFGYESQHWFNGGSAVDPNSSFGTTGFHCGLGFDW